MILLQSRLFPSSQDAALKKNSLGSENSDLRNSRVSCRLGSSRNAPSPRGTECCVTRYGATTRYGALCFSTCFRRKETMKRMCFRTSLYQWSVRVWQQWSCEIVRFFCLLKLKKCLLFPKITNFTPPCVKANRAIYINCTIRCFCFAKNNITKI